CSFPGFDFVAMPAIGPVEPAIGPQERSVKVAAVAVEIEFAHERLPVDLPVLLLKLPQVGMRSGVQGAVVPQDAGGKHEASGVDRALGELPVAVGILQNQNAAKLFLQFQ